jgi:chemotaxis protein methyltransferase CheR
MTTTPHPPEFITLKQHIFELVGFDAVQYTDNFVRRRVDAQMRAIGMTDYLAYLTLLKKDPKECDKLRRELTIHTTNFYRDREMWNVFTDTVIPEVVGTHPGKKLRIWSAGCSTGDEPLTIAMCFAEALKDYGNWQIKILATDIDADTVRRAREATYESQQFKEMPTSFLTKYFDKIGDSLYKAKPLILGIIDYQEGDILNDPLPLNIDIVFCRNTVIYFDTDSKSQLYEEIYKVIVPGGFFIMGKTEILHGPAREMFNIYNTTERIYMKQ